jgi:hypothetical protein
MRGSHNMAIERVFFQGGKAKKEKKHGVGARGKTSWRSKGLWSPHVVVIKRFSIITCRWWPKTFGQHNRIVIEFGRHLMTSIKFGHHQMTAKNFSHPWWIGSIFGHHLGLVKWWLNFFLTVQWWLIFEDVFEGIWVFKCNFWFIF